jgi:hypothetical protein
MTLLDRLQGGDAIPWIPDPAKAAKYEKDSCQLNPLIGIAVNHTRRTNFRGDGEYDVVTLLVEGVGEVAVHCQPTVLANQMREARPKQGEQVGCLWSGEKVGASGTSYAGYKVVVERVAEGSFDWADAEEPNRVVYDTPKAPDPQPQSPPKDPAWPNATSEDEIPF